MADEISPGLLFRHPDGWVGKVRGSHSPAGNNGSYGAYEVAIARDAHPAYLRAIVIIEGHVIRAAEQVQS